MWFTIALKRWFLISMIAGLAAALLWAEWVDWVMQPVRTRWVTMALLGLMSVGLDSRKLWDVVRRPWASALATAITFGLAPPLAYAAGVLLLPEEYRIGLIVAGSVPCTMASAAIWTRLAGGNEAVAVFVAMFTNAFVFLFTAGWLGLLTGRHVDVETTAMLWDLFQTVAAPIFLGQVARRNRWVSNRASRFKIPISVLCRLFILAMIVKSAAGAETMLASQERSLVADPQLAWVFVVCVGVHLTLLYAGFWIGRLFFDVDDAVAIAFSASQKTLPVGVFLIDAYYMASPMAIVPMLFFHIGQLAVDTYVAERFFYLYTHPKAVAHLEQGGESA